MPFLKNESLCLAEDEFFFLKNEIHFVIRPYLVYCFKQNFCIALLYVIFCIFQCLPPPPVFLSPATWFTRSSLAHLHWIPDQTPSLPWPLSCQEDALQKEESMRIGKANSPKSQIP